MAKLSARYAAALFELSMEKKSLDESYDQAVVMLDTLKGSECRRIITHPHISRNEKREFFDKIFGNGINEDLRGLLQLAISKNREAYILPSLGEFIEMADRYKRKTTATVVSAYELGAGEISQLKAALTKKLNKIVDISLKVDPSIIGGFYIYVDGYLIDRTIKKQLHDMKTSISKGYGDDS